MFSLPRFAVTSRLACLKRVPSTHAATRALHRSALSSPRRPAQRLLWSACLALGAAATCAFATPLALDAPPRLKEDIAIDPATDLTFPKYMKIQSSAPLPMFQLVGLGVRTVSFLGIRVYSVGFYADLSNPNLQIPKSATPDEKIAHIVQNTACVLRIIPTRSTSYTHLRDGFMRSMQARLALFKKRGELSPEDEASSGTPLRNFKSMFPNTSMKKGDVLDILLTAPDSREPSKARTLIVRDLGSIHHDWVAREFFMSYFEGDGISPPMKQSVVQSLETFGS